MCKQRTDAAWQHTSALMVSIEALFADHEIPLDKYTPENMRVLAAQKAPKRGIETLRRLYNQISAKLNK